MSSRLFETVPMVRVEVVQSMTLEEGLSLRHQGSTHALRQALLGAGFGPGDKAVVIRYIKADGSIDGLPVHREEVRQISQELHEKKLEIILLKKRLKKVQAAARRNVRMPPRCEGCSKLLMDPDEIHYGAEMVELCGECWDELVKEQAGV